MMQSLPNRKMGMHVGLFKLVLLHNLLSYGTLWRRTAV